MIINKCVSGKFVVCISEQNDIRNKADDDEICCAEPDLFDDGVGRKGNSLNSLKTFPFLNLYFLGARVKLGVATWTANKWEIFSETCNNS